MGEFRRRSLLDGDIAAMVEGPIDGAEWKRHIERHTTIARGKGLKIRAHFVAHIARCGGSVTADDNHIHLALLHEMTAEIIGDNGVRHAVRSKLKGRQRRTLVAWPGLVHPYMDLIASIMRHVDRRKRRAPISSGKPTGVAMGEDVHGAAGRFGQHADDLQAMNADRTALFDVGITDYRSFA